MSTSEIMRALNLSRVASSTWSMQVDRSLCIGRPDAKHLSGGACTAILVDAMQQHTTKPVIQASVQFIRAPFVDETIEIQPHVHRPGRSIDIVTAQMFSGQKACTHLMASFGQRDNAQEIQWTPFPNVPHPDTCKPLPFVRADAGDLHTLLDVRIAGAPKNGHLKFWVRTPEPNAAVDPRFLALIADYLPEAIHFNLGTPMGATSLDNSFRMIANEPTGWVMCEVELCGIQNGVFHGSICIFAENGKLLAQGAQSGVIRSVL